MSRLSAASDGCMRRYGRPLEQVQSGEFLMELRLCTLLQHTHFCLMMVGMGLSRAARWSREIGHGQLRCRLSLAATFASVTSCTKRSWEIRWNHFQSCSPMACQASRSNVWSRACSSCTPHGVHHWLHVARGNCHKEQSRTCTTFHKYGIQKPPFLAIVSKSV